MGLKRISRQKINKKNIKNKNKAKRTACLMDKKLNEDDDANKYSKEVILNNEYVEPLNKDFIYLHVTVEGEHITLLTIGLFINK